MDRATLPLLLVSLTACTTPGLTPVELKEVLTRELSEYVTAPDVAVIVVEMNSQFVSVVGEVGR